MFCVFLITVSKSSSSKAVAVHIVAVDEKMYFPTHVPVSDIIDSFNFSALMGEMVFVCWNIHISLIIS